METVKMNARGQITLPIDIRQELNLKEVRTERRAEKEKSFKALKGILAGYEIDLDKERDERINSAGYHGL